MCVSIYQEVTILGAAQRLGVEGGDAQVNRTV